jgi:iron complex outermembrane recepter protein
VVVVLRWYPLRCGSLAAYAGSRTQAGHLVLIAGAAIVLHGGIDAAQAASVSNAPPRPVPGHSAKVPGKSTIAPAPAPATEDIIVTVRRRSEPLQKAPVAVSVFTSKQAEKLNAHDLGSILAFVPSASFQTAASANDRIVFVRGMGTTSTSPGVEPSVSTVIDGVVLARAGEGLSELIDLDQIEVLRGPQGTLFGKNASAGAINMTTATPTSAFHAYAGAQYFSGDEYRLTGGVSGTLVPDKLTANLGVLVSGYSGNVYNSALDKEVNGYQHRGFRSKLAWTPDDNTIVTLGLDYIHANDPVVNGVFSSASRIAFPTGAVSTSAPLVAALRAEGITPSNTDTTISNNNLTQSIDDNGGASVTVDRKLAQGYHLTSISAYRRWQNDQDQDYDQLSQPYRGLPQVYDQGRLAFWQASQELRIASPKGHFFDYVAGLYYLHTDSVDNYHRDVSALPGDTNASAVGNMRSDVVGNNYAVFGEGNLNFTKKFRAILGLRLLRDDLAFDFNRASTLQGATLGIRPPLTTSGSTAHDGYGDRIGFQYDITSDVNAYFTYSHGYKGPSFNVFPNMQISDTRALKPETSQSFEIGLKSQSWNRRLTLDFSGFIEDFSNYQANLPQFVNGGFVTTLINAGSVSTKGFEGDAALRPVRYMTLNGNFAYTYANIDKFNCPAGAAASCDVNGKPLPFAPRWKFVLGADYDRPISDRFSVDLNSVYTWQSRTQYSLAETPDTIQSAYGIWNGSIGITDRSHGLRLTLILRNILDMHYASYIKYGNEAGVTNFIPRDFNRYGGFELHKDF